MEGWHIFVTLIGEVVIFVFLHQYLGLLIALMAVIIIAVIIAASTLGSQYLGTMKRTVSGQSYRRGGLDMYEAEYIAAQHLLKKHHVDIFRKDAGTPDPEETTYRMKRISEMFEPDEGEEYWVVRLRVNESQSFGGQDTKIVIYIDGDGDVKKDYIMNSELITDEKYWRNPELWFRGIVPVTRKALSPKSIIARKMLETDDIPPEISAKILKDETGEK